MDRKDAPSFVLLLACGLVAGLQAHQAASPQQAPPATEVFLAELGADGVTSARNISNNPGYDNQPHFLPDGKSILFTSNRDGKQMDIYRFDMASGKVFQVTHTAEGEYSPTPTPDGAAFSVIRTEADGVQRLWRFNLDGTSPRVVLEKVMPVGYHAWIDEFRLALFVLGGQGRPNTLQIADVRTGAASIVVENIGRSLLRRPGTRQISYVHKPQGQPWLVKSLDPDTLQTTTLVPALSGSEDLAWLPDGTALMAQGSTIHRWRSGEGGWTPLLSKLPATVGTITRMAVSPDGRLLAFVAQPRAE